jgi:rhodanese-related sulfurtransferase
MINLFKQLLGGEDHSEIIQNGATILDVRTEQEYQSGHVKGSVNIPLQVLGQKMNKINKLQQPIVTCCASGMRSGIAATMLKRQGIEAYNGGSWTSVNQKKKKG